MPINQNVLCEQVLSKLPRNFFFKGFQPMAPTLDDSFLSSDQDINQILVKVEIKHQTSYSTIRNPHLL